MAGKRITATALARMLNQSPCPVYVLDDDLRIVFLNEACHQWLGPAAESLVGRCCVYYTGRRDQPAENLAAAARCASSPCAWSQPS